MKRYLYLDWLRVLATIAVVVIHVSAAANIGTLEPNHYMEWQEANLFDSFSRWAVPMFVMISGALLLSDQRVITLGDFLRKRASKVVIPFVGWSMLFYIYGAYKGYFPVSLKHGVKLFLSNEISMHLWFLYMIIGIYLITPILQVFVRNASKQNIEYFLFLWLYASVGTRLLDFYIHLHLNIELFYVTDYVGYFLLGYYLAHFEVPHRWRVLSYIGAIIGFIATVVLTYYYTVKANGQLNQFWYGYFSPNVLLCAVGLFIWCRYRFQESSRPLPLLFKWINMTSLGVYILHFWLMNNYLWKVYPQVVTYFNPILALPINIIITLALSVIITLILKKIPFVNKLVP